MKSITNLLVLLVCKPTKLMYPFAGLQDKIGKKKGIKIEKIYALLIINVLDQNSCYGDSLSWPLPSNIVKTVKASLEILLFDLNNSNFESTRKEFHRELRFYPLQNCSDM